MGVRKPIVCLSASLLLVTSCSNRQAAVEPRELSLRVVTWNIHGCATGIDSIIEELRRFDADVICLQEAWAGTADGKPLDQPASIARTLEMHQASAGSALVDRVEQRMAILSRGEITDVETLDAGTGRIYGVAGTIRCGDRQVRIFCIHLTSSDRVDFRDALNTSRARYAEAYHLSDLLTHSPVEAILAGDFNSLPGMPAHDLIARELITPNPGVPTFPSTMPVVALDHVYHSRGLRMKRGAVGRSRASDHVPVMATLVIDPAGQRRPGADSSGRLGG